MAFDNPARAEIWTSNTASRPTGLRAIRPWNRAGERSPAAVAGAEAPKAANTGAGSSLDALTDFQFLAGRWIMAGAVTAARVTPFNFFVMGAVPTT